MKREVVVSDKAPEAIGPYSACVKAGNFVYTAGQLGVDRQTGKFVEGGIRQVPFRGHVKYMLRNAKENIQSSFSYCSPFLIKHSCPFGALRSMKIDDFPLPWGRGPALLNEKQKIAQYNSELSNQILVFVY